ncbi:MAG: P1 family peptidase [Planctomycetota bacterium]|jgi:D-aminopeptidase|nr:P1 family peptidase [Planctomycetota bacterium]
MNTQSETDRKRCREWGLDWWRLSPGQFNAITDVEGVAVGHSTIIEGEGPLVPGEGPIRTGVTAVLPHRGNLFQEKVIAAVHTINGFGKVTGFEQIRELGILESPIALAETLNVGLVADALVAHALRENREIGIGCSMNPVVGECFHGVLSDVRGRHIREHHVMHAIDNAQGGAVEEGNIGGGTGNSCFGWKGGIGTSSRRLSEVVGGFTVGTLVQTNFGSPPDLIIGDDHAGRHLLPPRRTSTTQNCPPESSEDPNQEEDKGSIMIVLATDAPLSPLQLRRICTRAGAGLARTGTHHGHGSGDFVIGFSTAQRIPHHAEGLALPCQFLRDDSKLLGGLFLATVEAVEEAILNSMFMAETMTGRDSVTRHAFPVKQWLASILHR